MSTAATMNSAKGVALLLESGASPSLGLGVGPLGAVVSNSPLYYAATKGYTEVVKELCKAGADLNAGWAIGRGFVIFGTPLFFAAKHGRDGAVQVLLEAGADTMMGLSMGPGGILGRQTPLEVALSNNRHKAAKAIQDFLNPTSAPEKNGADKGAGEF